MRKPKKPSSSLFQPFDTMLGSIGAVRVLRILTASPEPLAPSVVADRTGLQRAAVGIILHRLAATGIVTPVGSGRRPYFRMEPRHPFASVLGHLFAEERRRSDAVLDLIRRAVSDLKPPPIAAWLVGSAARGEDTPSSDVDVVVVTADRWGGERPDVIDAVVTEVANLGVTLSIVQLGLDDVERLRVAVDPRWARWTEDAVALVGPAPSFIRTRAQA